MCCDLSGGCSALAANSGGAWSGAAFADGGGNCCLGVGGPAAAAGGVICVAMPCSCCWCSLSNVSARDCTFS
eukprot:2759284-Pyramimonas_sp.AAC.1